jgi:hypothetical protein
MGSGNLLAGTTMRISGEKGKGLATDWSALEHRHGAYQGPGADCLQHPLCCRFRQQLRPSVRPLGRKEYV